MRNASCVKGLEAASIGKTDPRGRVERKRAAGEEEARDGGRSRSSGWRMAEARKGKGGTLEWGRAETGPGLLGKCVTAYWSPSSTHNPLRQHLSPVVGRRWLAPGWGRGVGGKGAGAGRADKLLQQFIFIYRLSYACLSPPPSSLASPRYENARRTKRISLY